MKPTLLILAAGMASRYGSMKQTDEFGPHGETIIDYSIYDAIKAGFGKVSFIIKEEFAQVFKDRFEPRLAGKIETDYIYQRFDLSDYGITEDIERQKPWGTAHAVMEAHKQINEPFCVINADDFYGAGAFKSMADFLINDVSDESFALMGYEVSNTLSDNGSVSRGICEVDEAGHMNSITERTQVYWKDTGNGGPVVVYEENGIETELPKDARASMNFWGFTPKVFETSKALFKEFVEKNKANPKAEFFIPIVVDYLIQHKEATFKVIPTASKWFGVTYKDDKPVVKANIADLVEKGDYPARLF